MGSSKIGNAIDEIMQTLPSAASLPTLRASASLIKDSPYGVFELILQIAESKIVC